MTIVLNDETITFAMTWDNSRYREFETMFRRHNAKTTGIAKRGVWSALNSRVSNGGGRTSSINAAIKNVVDREYIVSVLHLNLPSDALADFTKATAFFLDSSRAAG